MLLGRILRMPKPRPHPLLDALRGVIRRLDQLKEIIVTTKQELLDAIADVKNVLVETGKDVARVADKLDAAVANGDLTDVAAAVAELRALAQSVDERAEASDPEQPPVV